MFRRLLIASCYPTLTVHSGSLPNFKPLGTIHLQVQPSAQLRSLHPQDETWYPFIHLGRERHMSVSSLPKATTPSPLGGSNPRPFSQVNNALTAWAIATDRWQIFQCTTMRDTSHSFYYEYTQVNNTIDTWAGN